MTSMKVIVDEYHKFQIDADRYIFIIIMNQ